MTTTLDDEDISVDELLAHLGESDPHENDGLLGDEEDDDFIELSEEDAQFLHEIIVRTIMFCEALSNIEFRPYQTEVAYRLIESFIVADAATITALQARQSGKSETVSTVIAGIVVLFPALSKTYKLLEHFKNGVWVGLFAPVDGQSDFVFGRVKAKLTSDHAKEFVADPELDVRVKDGAKLITLSNGSLVRRQTANPKAKVEGASYHIVVIDECQDADDFVVEKSIMPMLASTAGTAVFIGTPGFTKGVFYKTIQMNKREQTRRGRKQNHFQYDWRVIAKYNPNYGRFIKQEKLRWGEDSDVFQMSYCIKWMLDRGMLITEDDLDTLGMRDMEIIRQWYDSPCVAGIDVARTKDSTVVTVGWVDWDRPDAAGLYEVRVLNWLEISNTRYEEQYFLIRDFLMNYNLIRVAIDGQGMGGPMAERMKLLLPPHVEILEGSDGRPGVDSTLQSQSERWKHLVAMLQRRKLLFPAHSRARRTKVWKRFYQQMTDVEKKYQGQYVVVKAPEDGANANDDYVDSAALMASCTMDAFADTVEQFDAPWYARR